ncbi:hypothetical protein T439DRAFT_322773 [Meredithblackwellia eburnea MCA 4105]
MTEDGEEGPSKRRRVARACQSCRAKKSRCDGLFPRCTPCSELNYECRYDTKAGPGVTNVIVTKDYLASLEERIARLERRDEERSLLEDFGLPTTSSGELNGGVGSGAGTGRSTSQPNKTSPLAHSEKLLAHESPQLVDGMGALRFPQPGAMLLANPTELEYFGDTSGVSFHSLILQHFFLGPHPHPAPTAAMPRRATPTNPLITGVVSVSDFPPLPLARKYFDYFFFHTHRIYPFLHEATVRESYEYFWDHKKDEDLASTFTSGSIASQLALFFTLFAYADRLSREVDSKAHQYYETAKVLLASQRTAPQDVTQVQVLVLGALFMQGSDDPEESWNLLGMAVRCGYGMGLHRMLAPTRATQVEREARKRTWCACFTLDRLMTVSLDRPTAISTDTSQFPLPMALPDEDPSLVSFFNASINLYRLLSDVPSDLANFSVNTLDTHTIQGAANTINTLEGLFSKWYADVPDFLRLDTLSSKHNQEAIVLAFRSQTVRLLLHRPLLTAAIRASHAIDQEVFPNPSDPSYVGALVAKQQITTLMGASLSTTLATAVEATKLLAKTQETDTLSAGWYRLFYALNSFMSLAAGATLDLSRYGEMVTTPRETIIEALHTGRSIVFNLGERYNLASAQRSVIILDQILSVSNLNHAPEVPFIPALSRAPSRAQSPSAVNWDDLILTMDLGMLPTFNFLQGAGDQFTGLEGVL